jgi:diguanylate cyclase (GGDEF)-like protein
METPTDSHLPHFQQNPDIHSLVAGFPALESIELHSHSTLEVLPCYEMTVDINQPGRVIASAFDEDPHLPGVIICDQEQLLGMISRQRFLYCMSQPYSVELYLQRPIQRFWEMFNTTFLELPCNCLITQAVQNALTRPYPNLYEPLAVRFSNQVLKVLDLHLLLLVQSQLLVQVTQLQAQTQARLQQQNEALKATEIALRETNRELHEQATKDGLTGVSNRRQFEETLRKEWQRLRRVQQPLSLIICDVDEFKRYNDTYGHQAGDACLQEVAKAIATVAKRPSDLVSRYGGEEFTLLLPNTPLNGAQEVAQLLRQSLSAKQLPHHASQVSSFVTMSMGISCLVPTGEFSPEVLIQQADAALYEAKKQGRDRAVSYQLLQ